ADGRFGTHATPGAGPTRSRRERSPHALERHEREREWMARVRRMRRALDLAPVTGVERRKVGVSGGLGVDLGEIDPIRARQELLEDTGAAEHDDLFDLARERQCLGGCARHEAPVAVEVGIAREDDARAIREGPADGLERAPSHDERLPHGELAYVPHIVGKPPGKVPILADDPVAVAGDDECDPAQTAIFALIGGWCW